MSVNPAELAGFYPLDSLRPENLEQLAREAMSEFVAKGTVLFNTGDTDENSLFLLSGSVHGEYPDGRIKDVDANSLQGRYPLGDLQPRRFTATVSSSTATVIKLERRYIEKIQTWDQLSRAENFRYYDAAPEANRWVFRLLQSRAMLKLPSGSIERMFQGFEEIEVAAGTVVIREGQAADFFYVIKEGAASVAKSQGADEAVVAYLVRGDSFGEDALLTNNPRNATVTMLKDGRLMRLSKQTFDEIMKPPVVDWATSDQALSVMRQGGVLLDVRMPQEYGERAIKGAINTPLYTLRETVVDFDKSKFFIVYCNTGERSAAAAFILTKLGFKASALRGGLSSMVKLLENKA